MCACPGGCVREQLTCQPQNDHCSCKVSQDLGSFSLQALNNPSAPLHTVGPDLTNYYYNPCGNITVKGPNGFCEDVASCQINESSGADFALGLQSQVSYRVSTVDPNVVTLMYTDGSAGKSFYVEAHCSQEPDQLVFRFLSSVPTSHGENSIYHFYLESEHACPCIE